MASIAAVLSASLPLDKVTIGNEQYTVLAAGKRRDVFIVAVNNHSYEGTLVVGTASGTRAYAEMKCRSCGETTWVRWSFARGAFVGVKLCNRCHNRRRKQHERWLKSEQGKRLAELVAGKGKQ